MLDLQEVQLRVESMYLQTPPFPSTPSIFGGTVISQKGKRRYSNEMKQLAFIGIINLCVPSYLVINVRPPAPAVSSSLRDEGYYFFGLSNSILTGT